MITLYGSANSSAGRCIWLLEELNVPYEQKELDMKAREQKSEWFLKLNPNGKVPVVVDGELVLWESFAINHYLAEKYKPELLGRILEDKARVAQWSWWGALHVQKYFDAILYFVLFNVGTKEHAIKAGEDVKPYLVVLEAHLSERDFVVGKEFTLADLNLGSIINIGIGLNYDFSPYPSIMAWMGRLKTRPAMISLLAKLGR
jgi:glutathione S-transferase